jgi:hypothetical protein
MTRIYRESRELACSTLPKLALPLGLSAPYSSSRMTDSTSVVGTEISARTPGVIARVFRAALVVFALDGLYVVVVFVLILQRTTVKRMFQGIAFAVLGQPAFTGGWPAASLGLLLHFSVALAWSVVWMIAYQRSERLQRATIATTRAAVVGAVYGLFIWLAMHFVVLPLTYAKPGPLFTFSSMLVAMAHLLVVGPPIALLERSHVR